jgi:hypothetical protein
MARLSHRQRAMLPDSAFAIPERRAYPIHDRAHARAALARVARWGSAADRRRVRAAVARRYPDMVADAPRVPAGYRLHGLRRR